MHRLLTLVLTYIIYMSVWKCHCYCNVAKFWMCTRCRLLVTTVIMLHKAARRTVMDALTDRTWLQLDLQIRFPQWCLRAGMLMESVIAATTWRKASRGCWRARVSCSLSFISCTQLYRHRVALAMAAHLLVVCISHICVVIYVHCTWRY